MITAQGEELHNTTEAGFPSSRFSRGFGLGTQVGQGMPRLIPRVRRRTGFFKIAEVEALPQGDSWRVLWATDALAIDDSPFWPCVETTSATVDPRSCDELRTEDDVWAKAESEGSEDGLRIRGGRGGGKPSEGSFVFQGDQFEVRVVGFSVTNFDLPIPGLKGQNELILSSMEKTVAAKTDQGPNTGLSQAPKIHFDFRKDHTTEPDKYQPVPDGSALATRCYGSEGKTDVNVNFLIMEIDNVSDETRATIDSVGSLAERLQDATAVMPYMAAMSPVLSLAGDLGNMALKAYAKPDRVIGTDMDFKILRRGDASLQRSGDYLRFGYYFFLSKPLNVKLYAATRGSKNVRLLMRDENMNFVPLTHVSYVVVKVLVPQEDLVKTMKPVFAPENALRLQVVCENIDQMTAEEVKEEITNVMGALNSTKPSEVAPLSGDSAGESSM